MQSLAGPCVSVKTTESGHVVATVWVHDVIFPGNNTHVLKEAKESLMVRLIQNERPRVLSWFLRIQFKHKGGCIEMNHNWYVAKLLSKLRISDCKPKAVPCEQGANKGSETDESDLMTRTRLDLCYLSKPMAYSVIHPGIHSLNLLILTSLIILFQRFSTPPTIYVTASHEVPKRPQDAMAVWVEELRVDNFKICLTEAKIFDGPHKGIKIVSKFEFRFSSQLSF